jgi:hypothetical protein
LALAKDWKDLNSGEGVSQGRRNYSHENSCHFQEWKKKDFEDIHELEDDFSIDKMLEATKKKILGRIFAEELDLENGRVATSVFTEPIQFILNASGVLGSSKKTRGRFRPLVPLGTRSGT